ncbi:hypothetical protein L1887_05612 [Cichorium endivia]|nr:hypothetical protein L1887_05612 [Cichorium endivia]
MTILPLVHIHVEYASRFHVFPSLSDPIHFIAARRNQLTYSRSLVSLIHGGHRRFSDSRWSSPPGGCLRFILSTALCRSSFRFATTWKIHHSGFSFAQKCLKLFGDEVKSLLYKLEDPSRCLYYELVYVQKIGLLYLWHSFFNCT